MTMAEVYTTSTKHVIRSTKSLGVLGSVWLDTIDNLTRVPTWAPRWDRFSGSLEGTSRLGLVNLCQFSASGTSCAVLVDDLLDGLDILSLEGRPVDSILHLGCAYPRVVTSVLSPWETLAPDFQLLTRSRPNVSCSTNIKSFVWAITAGHGRPGNRMLSRASEAEHLESFPAMALNDVLRCLEKGDQGVCLQDMLKLANFALEALPPACCKVNHHGLSANSRQRLKDAIQLFHCSYPAASVMPVEDILRGVFVERVAAMADHFSEMVNICLCGRRLFITKNGHVGIAPHYVQEGDIICLLYGGNTPYVLRPLPNKEEYMFLGECYVYGMTDGEAMPADEDRKKKLQCFRPR